MPEPVLRIPVDDEAFQRYMEAFGRYQEQLREQPEMWEDVNSSVRDGIAANLSLADAIGASVAAAVRLGDVQERNAQRRRKDSQDEDAEQQRASTWRRKALDHVQELSRTSASIVRGFGNFASGANGTGGLFSMVSDVGKGLGGTLGGIVNLVGHALNAGYEINNAVSEKGLFARGIGTSISGQEGFQNNLGRLVNTDQGIDAVMNARGNASQWADFARLGVRGFTDPSKSNTDLYADVLRQQARIAQRYTKGNYTNWQLADAFGASAFGTTHEDLNRIMKDPDLAGKIAAAQSFKSPLADKQTDAATKAVIAQDNLTTHVRDTAQAFAVGFDPALDKATAGLSKLAALAEKIVGFFPSNWSLDGAMPTIRHETDAERRAAEADPNNPRGKGLWGGLKAMWNSDWVSVKQTGEGNNYQQWAGDQFQKAGWSANQTKGLLSNIQAESSFNPFNVGDSGKAFGLGQWHADRQAMYAKLYGHTMQSVKDPRQALREQLGFIQWELTHTEKKAGDRLRQALTAYDAGRIVSRDYERPASRAEDLRRGRTAENVTVNVKVTAPTGMQTAVTTNSAAKG